MRGGAGRGGEEAALWAADLLRMYKRYAEGQGWRTEAMTTALAERGLTRVLVEGGPTLATAMLRGALVGRLVWFQVPCLLGRDGRGALVVVPLLL